MLRSIATVFAGTVMSQVIGLALLPILSRLYGPDEFGVFQTYSSTLRVMLMAAALRYEVGLLEARDEGQFVDLFRACMTLTVVSALVVAAASVLAGDWLAAELSVPVMLVWAFPALLFIAGLQQTTLFLPIRERNYALSSRNRVAQSVYYGVAALGFSLFPSMMLALPAADGVARLGAAIGLIFGTKGLAGKAVAEFGWSGQVAVFAQFRRYPLYTFPGTLLSSLSMLIMVLAFVRLFDIGVAGQFGLVMQVLMGPLAAVNYAISQVFTGDMATVVAANPKQAHAIFRRLVKVLIGVGLPGAIVGYFVAPPMIVLVFGETWRLAGDLCAAAMPLALATFVVAPVNMVLILIRRNAAQLGWEVLRFAATGGVYLAFAAAADPTPTQLLWAFSAVFLALYLVYLAIADRALAAFSRLSP